MVKDHASAIGFCGLGLMGAAMVGRLLSAGHAVTVWNRSPDKAEPFVAQGARLAATPAELAAGCATVMLCLGHETAVQSVVFGADGLVTAGQALDLVDHSSISPQTTRDFARRLQAQTGGHWIDAPVSGGIGGAARGTLAVMAGGDGAAIDRCRPVLQAYARSITRLGDSGAGQTAKLCNQTIVATTLSAIAEAVCLAERSGIDASALSTALAGGWADSVLLQTFIPRMTHPPEASIGSLATMAKDIDNVAAAALAAGAQLPVLQAVRAGFHAAQAQGLGELDLSQIVRIARNP